MCTRIAKYKHAALESCKFRGHSMSEWVRSGATFIATCTACKMDVRITELPLVNEVEVVGEAVALHCSKGLP